MFTSQLFRNEKIINDESPNVNSDAPGGYSTGLDLSFRTSEGYRGVAEAFPDNLLIPESEWEPRIKEMEERKSRGSDIATQEDLPCKDQNGIPYCWVNAPTYCFECVRIVQGQQKVIFSPASAGAPIKNFRSVGGWGKEALEYIIKFGLVPIDKWPANAIDRQYYTSSNKELALRYRCLEWFELTPRNKKQLISALLRRMPVAVGYNWWGHEVSGIDAVWLDGEVAIRIRNSWGMSWGDKGYGILQGSKMLPDDAVVPLSVSAAA